MKKVFAILSIIMAFSWSNDVSAQCEAIADACDQFLPDAYIPDGQFHFAMLKDQETAAFEMTLFGGTTYRMAACSGTSEGNLYFTVYDEKQNELFSNRDNELAPYWDFVVANTIDVTIEANLNEEKASSGCAVLMVGFKK